MVPSVGPSGMLTSYYGAVRTLADYTRMVQTGYAKYRGGMFKIPITDQWLVVLSGPELITEYSRAREQDLSADHAILEVIDGYS